MDILTVNDTLGEYPKSLYAATSLPPGPFACAKGDIHTDVCVVGGGFTGLSTALHLARRGYKTVVLEASRVGAGASGRNGGQVGTGQRLDQFEIEAFASNEKSHALWSMGLEAVNLVRELATQAPDGCEWTPGIIHANHRDRFTDDSKRYSEHLNKHYGYELTSFLSQDEIRRHIGSDNYVSGVLDMGGGHIHPLKFAFVLSRLAITSGAALFENSRVIKIEDAEKGQGSGHLLHTDGARIHAKKLVIATNGYHNNLDANQSKKVMPINNFIAATRPLDPDFASALIKDDHAVSDSRFVVNYFRLSRDRRLIFGGGESYGYRFPKNLKGKVRKKMLEIFPQLENTEIDYAWGGTLGITMSRLPQFERVQNDVYSMAGFSGHGIAMGTFAGKLAADAISGDAENFDVFAGLPSRNFPGGPMLQTPLLALAMIWYSLRDRL